MATLTSAYELNNVLFTLNKFKETINEKSDFIKTKSRVLGDLKKMSLALSELMITLDKSSYVIDGLGRKLDLVYNMMDCVESATTSEEIASLLFLEELEGDYIDWGYDDLRYYYMNISTDGASAADLNPTILESIAKKIKSNNEIKLFDVRCKRGFNAQQIKKGIDNVYIYGSERNVEFAKDAKEIVNRCIKGGLEGSKISNEVFDVVFVVPELTYEVDYTYQGTLKERREKAAIRNTIKYLRPDGLYVYSIPFYRLTREIAFILAKNLDDVSMVKHADTVGIKYVTIIGRKKASKEVKHDIYEYLTSFKTYGDITPFDRLKEYHIEGKNLEVNYFRGSVFDNEELDLICSESGMYDTFWDSQYKTTDLSDTRPLLPFNMGQIGLVLTSGCLDGVIEEYEGQYHAIKGRVVKVKNVLTEMDPNGTDQLKTEKYTNIVQINIFTPDGEFIELT